jgi:hypothetical protein
MIKGLFFKMNTDNKGDQFIIRFFDEHCKKEKCTKKELLNKLISNYLLNSIPHF